MIKIVEWFGGLGAASMALKRLDSDTIIADYVELDKNAVKAFNLINNTNYDPKDINDLDVTSQKYEDVDLLVAGWPCQDFSQAGKGKGLEGNRSNLILTTIEKLKELKKLNRLPKYILLENVKGLVSKRHIGDFNDIMDHFDDLGYNHSFRVLNSKDFGVPQSRERVFIFLTRKDLKPVNLDDLQPLKVQAAIKDILEWNPEHYDLYGQELELGQYTHYYIKNKLPQYNGKIIKIDLDKLNNQQPGKINTVALLGTVEDHKFTTVSYNSNKSFLGVDGISKTLRAGDSYFQNKIIFTKIPFNQDRNFLGVEGITNTIVTSSPHNKNKIMYQKHLKVFYRNLTTLELWRLMDLDEKHYHGLSKRFSFSALAKMIGNSIVVKILEEIFRQLILPIS